MLGIGGCYFDEVSFDDDYSLYVWQVEQNGYVARRMGGEIGLWSDCDNGAGAAVVWVLRLIDYDGVIGL